MRQRQHEKSLWAYNGGVCNGYYTTHTQQLHIAGRPSKIACSIDEVRNYTNQPLQVIPCGRTESSIACRVVMSVKVHPHQQHVEAAHNLLPLTATFDMLLQQSTRCCVARPFAASSIQLWSSAFSCSCLKFFLTGSADRGTVQYGASRRRAGATRHRHAPCRVALDPV